MALPTEKDLNEIYKKKRRPVLYKKFMHILQALIAFPIVLFFRILPLDCASFIGGKLAVFIGPKLKEHKVALMNLELAFPNKSQEERQEIIMKEWENIGRLLGEYPHISRKKILERITVEGTENVKKALDKGKGVIFTSLHMGNWELFNLVATNILGIKLNLIYRRPNNPLVEKLFRLRAENNQSKLIPKDMKSGFQIMRLLHNKEHVALLIDQKLNEGIEISFFSHKAMTTPMPALMSLRYETPVILAKCERTNGANFKITFAPEIKIEKTNDKNEYVNNFSQKLNDCLEEWITQNPSQWLWIHKRWNKDVFDKKKT